MKTQLMAAYECAQCHLIRPFGFQNDPKEARLHCEYCRTSTLHTAAGIKTFDVEITSLMSGFIHARFSLIPSTTSSSAASA